MIVDFTILGPLGPSVSKINTNSGHSPLLLVILLVKGPLGPYQVILHIIGPVALY